MENKILELGLNANLFEDFFPFFFSFWILNFNEVYFKLILLWPSQISIGWEMDNQEIFICKFSIKFFLKEILDFLLIF